MNMKIKVEFCPIELVELIHLCDQELQARKKGIRKQGFCGDSAVLVSSLDKLLTSEAKETGEPMKIASTKEDYRKYAAHLMQGLEVLNR